MAVKAKPKSVVMGYCVNDSREYPSDRFYEHKNIELFPKGLVPYCKDCCNAMLKYYLKNCVPKIYILMANVRNHCTLYMAEL
jgi:hypothetical protein